MYGAFPVCRNYTVRAYIRSDLLAKRRRHQDSAAECRTCNRFFHIGCLRTCINENAAGQRETNAELYRRASVRKIVKSGQIGGQEVFAHKKSPENTQFPRLFVWRRRRDSNPRDAFDAYAISSRAPSTKLGDFSILALQLSFHKSAQHWLLYHASMQNAIGALLIICTCFRMTFFFGAQLGIAKRAQIW